MCAGLVVVTLLSSLVLHAIMPRPYMDPEPPWFTLGPNCGDKGMEMTSVEEKRAANPDCSSPGSWSHTMFGKTYTKETWPDWWWELF